MCGGFCTFTVIRGLKIHSALGFILNMASRLYNTSLVKQSRNSKHKFILLQFCFPLWHHILTILHCVNVFYFYFYIFINSINPPKEQDSSCIKQEEICSVAQAIKHGVFVPDVFRLLSPAQISPPLHQTYIYFTKNLVVFPEASLLNTPENQT